MIVWRDVTSGADATVFGSGGTILAILRARPTYWRIEFMHAELRGPANSVPNAKSEALAELARQLEQVQSHVQIALRST